MMKLGLSKRFTALIRPVGKSFHDMPIHPVVLGNIARLGFVRMTPIQERTLPISLAGRDVAGQAQTGTGKTAAFPDRDHDKAPVAPAGEKGGQAGTAGPDRGAHPGAGRADRGGRGGSRDGRGSGSGRCTEEWITKAAEDADRGLDILIGTPGRLIDYFKQKVYTLDGIEVLVIDEADRMFDMGFISGPPVHAEADAQVRPAPVDAFLRDIDRESDGALVRAHEQSQKVSVSPAGQGRAGEAGPLPR